MEKTRISEVEKIRLKIYLKDVVQPLYNQYDKYELDYILEEVLSEIEIK